MNDATTRSHPLNTACFNYTAMTNTITMTHLPGKEVSYGFKSTMRVGRKARDVVIRIIRLKKIEQQKAIELGLESNADTIDNVLEDSLNTNKLLKEIQSNQNQ